MNELTQEIETLSQEIRKLTQEKITGKELLNLCEEYSPTFYRLNANARTVERVVGALQVFGVRLYVTRFTRDSKSCRGYLIQCA